MRHWITLCEVDEDDDDFEQSDQPVKQVPPYQFLRLLTKHQAKQNKAQWRKKQRRRFRDEEQAAEEYERSWSGSRHVAKSQMGYKPFGMSFIRFGKYRMRSRIFLDPELRSEMGNVTHEEGVSCYQATPWQDGYLVHQPDSSRAAYGVSDPFGLIFRTFDRQLINYLDHGVPMDIFLMRGHLVSFGRNKEMISLGSDGEFLLDLSKPHTSEPIAPEQVYLSEKSNLVQAFNHIKPIEKIRADVADHDVEMAD